ncbi:MAG: multidrug ABC transporter permease [Gemmatimonadetes bacterium]|nr:MAG: multidrug ABC transporter permease [Gemmatimonadota bacterium]PYP26854.1 MAG: multidrug ABC transporter permease [Gemmatimonadota bacterium]
MKIPLVYNVRSVLQRPVSTALTALGIALVVAVFIGMLALASGFRTALVRTGSDRNVLVLRRGADSELSSGLSRETASILAASPHVATGADGHPLVSPEVYVLIPLPKIFDTTQVANVVARGVSDQAWTVRSNVRVVAGRKPESGRSEICVGQRIVARFPRTGIGETLRFAGRDWSVVCHFAAGGSAFESEIWGENEQFMPVFRGQVFQSITMRLSDPGAFAEVKRALETDKRMTVDVHRESDFYVQQSQLLGRLLRVLAFLITGIMAIGAVFGAVNTMYAAVASRAPEIGVLLTLGFHPRSVLASFLLESAIIAAAGGAAGCLFALPINGIVTSTTNWASFSEIAFSFRVTPGLLLAGLVFAVVMGVLGGFFPARRAARVPVVQAIR